MYSIVIKVHKHVYKTLSMLPVCNNCNINAVESSNVVLVNNQMLKPLNLPNLCFSFNN